LNVTSSTHIDTVGYAPSSYQALAGEYYDPGLHPTCDALGRASHIAISGLLPIPRDGARILEVGAGKGCLSAPWLQSVRTLIESDVSIEMLRHRERTSPGHAAVFDGEKMAIKDKAIDVIVSGLGDPYNTRAFWEECERCLALDGLMVWSTPSHAWARRWRMQGSEPEYAARFDLANGAIEYVRSIVLPEASQNRLLEEAGLRAIRTLPVAAGRAAPLPPKVTSVLRPDDPLVVGYLIARV
jgi:2-polyprenyl-3-methyl-5-hydroxy-6-metoxy-1,4-benzoquinol methylase